MGTMDIVAGGLSRVGEKASVSVATTTRVSSV